MSSFVLETISKFFLPLVSFLGGLFARRLVDWWKFVRARARYAYWRKTYPKDTILLLDSAIPKFELDGQSISPTEEVFLLRPICGVGLEEVNERLSKYHDTPPFVFEEDQVFGSQSLSRLKDITGIEDIAKRVDEARRKVCEEFLHRAEGRIFNGRKLGLRNFNFDRVGDDERSRLDLRVYETDYFTHSVMQKVIRQYMRENPDFIVNVEKNYRTLINERYFPFLTSIGLNVFLFTDLKRKIVFSRRSASTAGGNSGAGKLHVSMNEGLSFTDFQFQQRGEGQVTLLNCFRRGLREELGFNEYDNRIGDLSVYDSFIVRESFQFGLFGWCAFQGHFPEILEFRAQDKQMESRELLDVNFTGSALKAKIRDEAFVPYTRVGLENLCRIHGIGTFDVESRGFDYIAIWASVAFESIFGRRAVKVEHDRNKEEDQENGI